jgi:hypothetical protein
MEINFRHTAQDNQAKTTRTSGFRPIILASLLKTAAEFRTDSLKKAKEGIIQCHKQQSSTGFRLHLCVSNQVTTQRWPQPPVFSSEPVGRWYLSSLI